MGIDGFQYYIIVECVKALAMIFGVIKERKEIESSKKIFGDVLNVNGCDGDFFGYIRSLCAVHPTETSRKNYRYLKDTLFHCCPFVCWNNSFNISYDDGRDLSAFVYQSKEKESLIIIPLYIEQFKRYVQAWLNLIPTIIDAIKCDNDHRYEELCAQQMRNEDSFQDICDYIAYLRDEHIKRYLGGQEYIYNYFIRVVQTNFSNESNNEKLEKYKNAIKYSLPFRHHSLQHMAEDGYENTGIKNKKYKGDDLFNLLEYPFCSQGAFKGYSYNLSKILNLSEDSGCSSVEKQYVRNLIDEMKDVLNRFVVYTGKESDKEKIILVSLALYLDALEQNCELNRSIPNENKYRQNILSTAEMNSLFVKEDKDTTNAEDVLLPVKNDDGSITQIKLTEFMSLFLK